MPPKAKKSAPPPPPTPSLKDCHLAFVRLIAAGIDGVSRVDINTQVANQGGTIVSKVDQCTHFIASEDQYQKPSSRVKEAMSNHDVKIVTFDWLKESFNASSKVDEAKYLLSSSNGATQKDAKDDKDTATAGTKRGRTVTNGNDDTDDKTAVNKKVKVEDDQAAQPNTNSKALNIPLDDFVTNNHKVFVDDDGTIYDVTLNQTNSGQNNNKFYRIQLLVDTTNKYWCWTRWGRVGERGQMKMLGDGNFDLAFKEFGKKFKDKNGNSWENRLEPIKSGKYSYIERSYEDSDDEGEDDDSKTQKQVGSEIKEEDTEEQPVESKLPKAVQQLMELIFNKDFFDSTLASLDYDATKMPLGKLSKSSLLRGYTVLKDLTAIMDSGRASAITDLSNQYFSLIPHAFGRSRPPILNNMPMIKKEIELLESLTDMQLANDIIKNAKGKKTERMNLLDRQYEGLGMQEMTPLDMKSVEFKELESYLMKSGGHTHHITYAVQDIFRIERQGEDQRFKDSKFATMPNSDRRLLWHGSRCTNFGGILSQGLRIAPPEAPVNGYMFGKGVYLADMSTKSANYCCAYNSGGIALLLLCEAELGKPPLKLTNANSNAAAVAINQGSVSTWGVGMTAPLGWKDAGCIHKDLKGVLVPDVVKYPPGPTNEPGAYLQYNEYIAYDIAQVKLRYLIRCKIN